MKQTKILHLITGLDIGGAEKQLCQLLPYLNNKYENHVCVLKSGGSLKSKIEANGIKVTELNLNLINLLPAIFKFFRLIHRLKPDVLINYLIYADLFGRIFGKIFGIGIIISSQRGSLLHLEWLRVFDRASKHLINLYTVQTLAAKKELINKLKLVPHKVKVIPNGIDASFFNTQVDRNKMINTLGLSKTSLKIVCVSRLRIKKGHEYLLEAFEKIYRRGSDIELIIAGDGDQEQKLKKQISSYNSKTKIHFLGARADVKDILNLADIFVLATEAEGMSNAILEAMATGLPCIVSDITENRALIKNRVNGLLFKNRDVKQLQITLFELINNASLRQELGLEAKKTITRNFLLDTVSKQLIKQVDDLIASNRAQYCFRIDDVHPRMNWQNFYRLQKIFTSSQTKPILGIIPDNKDQKLNSDKPNKYFWDEIRNLADQGWIISQHGYQHKYINNNSGLLKVNKYSEFAGLPYLDQFNKIKKGKEIIERNLNRKVDWWMAPAHSFDQTTCRVLKDLSFKYITDGIATSPFYKYGLIWLPQQLWRPVHKNRGTWTICLHPNTISNDMIHEIEEFIASPLNPSLKPISEWKINKPGKLYQYYWYTRQKLFRIFVK